MKTIETTIEELSQGSWSDSRIQTEIDWELAQEEGVIDNIDMLQDSEMDFETAMEELDAYFRNIGDGEPID